jgi:hypothetical protein
MKLLPFCDNNERRRHAVDDRLSVEINRTMLAQLSLIDCFDDNAKMKLLLFVTTTTTNGAASTTVCPSRSRNLHRQRHKNNMVIRTDLWYNSNEQQRYTKSQDRKH